MDWYVIYEILKGVKIFGGFLGNEVIFEEWDIIGVFSILSGDIGVFMDSIDNCYYVLMACSFDEYMVLDCFYIRYGNSNGNIFDICYGGGLFIIIEEGDILVFKMIICNCIFESNSGFYGVVIGVNSLDNLGIMLRFENCYFIFNWVIVSGGVFYRSEDNGSIFDMLIFK